MGTPAAATVARRRLAWPRLVLQVVYTTAAFRPRLSAPAQRTALFGLLSFLVVGLPRLFTNTGALTLFLEHWDARWLPVTYLGAAVAVPIVGVSLLALQRRLGFARLLPWVLVLDIGVLVLLRHAVEGPAAAAASVALAVWVEVEWALVSLVFWGLAERVFRLREAKRSFGIIGAGEPLAALAGGLAVPLLLRALPVADLLWLSVASQVLTLLVLAPMLARNRERLDRGDAETPHEASVGDGDRLATRRFLAWVMLLVVTGEMLALVVDNAFFASVEQRYTDSRAVAEFVGVFLALVGACSLLGNFVACGWLLDRFGVLAGLALLPVLVLAGVGAGAVAGGAVLFWSVALTKLLDESVRTGVYRPAFLVLLQALPAARRTRAQVLAEGVSEPVAAALAGTLLLVLGAWAGIGVDGLMLLAGLLAALWLVQAVVTWRHYLATLHRALARRRVELDPPMLDRHALRRVLLAAVRGERATDAVFAVHLMGESGLPDLPRLLEPLLAHPVQEVRLAVLELVERRHPARLRDALERRARHPLEPTERAALLRALAAVDVSRTRPLLEQALETGPPALRTGAMVALLRHGGIDGALCAGEHLQAMVRSRCADERARAAQLLGEVGVQAFAPSLEALLGDADPRVRHAALRAAARLPSAALCARLLPLLDDARDGSRAAAALAAVGEAALPALLEAWKGAAPRRRRRNLLGVLGRLGTGEAVAFLARQMAADDPWIALRATRCLPADAVIDEALLQNAMLAAEAAARRCLAYLADAGALQGDGGALLRAALGEDLRGARERLVRLYLRSGPAPSSQRLLHEYLYGDEDRRGYAIELLEVALPRSRRAAVADLLEDRAPAVPQGDLAAVAARVPGLSCWTRACLRHALRDSADGAVLPELEDEEEALMMLAIEKVMVLRSVRLFEQVPAESLWELAASAVEQEVAAGEVVIREGEMGSTLYVVAAGEVAVCRGGARIATIGERDVFGELAALDPEPRSATVTTLVDSRLLVLHQTQLDQLLADDIDVVRGILRTLCGRLRQVTGEVLGQVAAAPSPETPAAPPAAHTPASSGPS